MLQTNAIALHTLWFTVSIRNSCMHGKKKMKRNLVRRTVRLKFVMPIVRIQDIGYHAMDYYLFFLFN